MLELARVCAAPSQSASAEQSRGGCREGGLGERRGDVQNHDRGQRGAQPSGQGGGRPARGQPVSRRWPGPLPAAGEAAGAAKAAAEKLEVTTTTGAPQEDCDEDSCIRVKLEESYQAVSPEYLELESAKADQPRYNIESEYDSDWTSAVQRCAAQGEALRRSAGTQPSEQKPAGTNTGTLATDDATEEKPGICTRSPDCPHCCAGRNRRGTPYFEKVAVAAAASFACGAPGHPTAGAAGTRGAPEEKAAGSEVHEDVTPASGKAAGRKGRRRGRGAAVQEVKRRGGVEAERAQDKSDRLEHAMEAKGAGKARPKEAASRGHCSGSLEAPCGSDLEARTLVRTAGAAATAAGSFVLLVRPERTSEDMGLRRLGPWEVT